jgi:uncharacterized membrane protein
MSQVAASESLRAPGAPDLALRHAAGLWFLVAVAGQWVFLYRVVAQYGIATVSGRFADWERNNEMYRGYVAGDPIGNLAFAAHVLLAAVISLGGAIQLIPQIRDRVIAVHRWNGRVFMLAGAVAAVSGLYMNWVRHANGGPVNSYGVTLNAVLILLCVAMAWRAVHSGDIDRHRRWALRAFVVMSGVLFKRLASFGWGVLAPGVNPPVMEYVFEFGSYLIPLAVLELYLRAKASPSRNAKRAAAVVLMVATGYMAVGTVAFAMWVLR